jgi:hypothetical protein
MVFIGGREHEMIRRRVEEIRKAMTAARLPSPWYQHSSPALSEACASSAAR